MLNLNNTLDGYLKNVEVIGNTVQDTNNLADIRSVGDKVEGQELYKIDVVSCGKNIAGDISDAKIIDNDRHLTVIDNGDGSFKIYGDGASVSGFGLKLNVKVVPNRTYTFSFKIDGKSTSTSPAYIYRGVNTLWQSDKLITNNNNKTFEVPSDVNEICIGFCYKSAVDTNPVIVSDIQLEEGTVATPYEPYKGDKLEILSPIQLEKVGDVADRIICKDGVWGVEKNVKTYVVSQDTVINRRHDSETGITSYRIENVLEQPKAKVITSKFKQILFDDIYSVGHATHDNNTHLYVRLEGDTTLTIAKQQLQGMLIKYMTLTPQFISLPHDQQVKLRTFAGQTNVCFNTEIPGQIKAQVPKSLGAVVNTHTEQIEMLHNALKSVLAGDMYSLATILYPEDFIQNDNTEQDIMVIPEQ